MPDCFLCYADEEQAVAEKVHDELEEEGADVFIASKDLEPGDNWAKVIRSNLKESEWVVFLATESVECAPYAQQEVGMALGLGKDVIPVMWGIEPTKLPGYVSEKHALDIKSEGLDKLRGKIRAIAQSEQKNPDTGLLLLGTLVMALFAAEGG